MNAVFGSLEVIGLLNPSQEKESKETVLMCLDGFANVKPPKNNLVQHFKEKLQEQQQQQQQQVKKNSFRLNFIFTTHILHILN